MKTISITLGALALLAGTALQAHHSFSMFDPAREEVITGTVTQWAYNSPHTLLFIEDEDGNPWVFEGAAPPSILGRSPSMTGTTFVPGQAITVVHCPLRDGRSGGGIGIVIVEDGTIYNPSDAGCNAEERSAEWPGWIGAGFTSLAEADAGDAGAVDPAPDAAAVPAPEGASDEGETEGDAEDGGASN